MSSRAIESEGWLPGQSLSNASASSRRTGGGCHGANVLAERSDKFGTFVEAWVVPASAKAQWFVEARQFPQGGHKARRIEIKSHQRHDGDSIAPQLHLLTRASLRTLPQTEVLLPEEFVPDFVRNRCLQFRDRENAQRRPGN